MTTSTTSKTKGPIRFEAVVPVTIVFVLSFLYFHFLFDHHLKKTIEWGGTYIHGAEVNVGGIKTSFLGGSFELLNLQVTDKTSPARNLVQIDKMHFGFLWDALLRAKFVVENAGITGIQVYSPRRRPGYVRPPEPPSNKPSTLAVLQNKVLDQTKDQFDGNMLGDLAQLIEGTDEKDLLKNIQGQLQAEARIKALKSELKEKEAAWKARIDQLPRKGDLDALNKRAKALKFDSKNPKQFADDIKEAAKIAKEADAIVDNIKDTTKNLKTDVDKYNSEFKNLDDLIKQDIADIEKRLKIPNLDFQDFSKNLFGNMFAEKLVSVQKYMEVGRKYLPPARADGEKKQPELIPPARGQGKTYRFPVTTGYPLFWLKKAEISSEPTAEGFSGRIRGQLTDVSSDPTIVKNPLILDVAGDFPKSQVEGVKLLLTVDHRNQPTEQLELTVNQFPVTNVSLINSSDLGLNLAKARGQTAFNVRIENQQFNIDLKNNFSQTEYDLTSKSKTTKDVVATVLAGIPTITLNAKATGWWDNINFNLNSNLGQELAAGLKKYVKARVDEMKKKVESLVQDKIKDEKDKLTQEYNQLKAQVDNTLKSKTAEIEKAKAELKGATDSKGQAKDQLKNDLKEKSKKLLKGIKF